MKKVLGYLLYAALFAPLLLILFMPGSVSRAMPAGSGSEALKTAQFRSVGLYDGWILEKSEYASVGGSINTTGNLIVGDDAGNRQYRSIVSFNTAALPDRLSRIQSVSLRLYSKSITGTSPFITHYPMLVDIKTGYFGRSIALVASDFQATATTMATGSSYYCPPLGYCTIAINSKQINRTGITQFRLRFRKDDNDDSGTDIVSFASGNVFTTVYRPTLLVYYYP